MTGKVLFFTRIWRELRPHAFATLVDFGQYLILWTGVLAAHAVKILVAAAGVEEEIIRAVSYVEKWVWIASFAAFFWRVLLRVARIRTAKP